MYDALLNKPRYVKHTEHGGRDQITQIGHYHLESRTYLGAAFLLFEYASREPIFPIEFIIIITSELLLESSSRFVIEV
jgi:hypothetical protein